MQGSQTVGVSTVAGYLVLWMLFLQFMSTAVHLQIFYINLAYFTGFLCRCNYYMSVWFYTVTCFKDNSERNMEGDKLMLAMMLVSITT